MKLQNHSFGARCGLSVRGCAHVVQLYLGLMTALMACVVPPHNPQLCSPSATAVGQETDFGDDLKTIVRFHGKAMGTTVTFMASAQDSPQVQAAFAAALAEICRLEMLMTTWPHPDWPPSDIMRLNAQAGELEPVHVSPETLAVLRSAVCMGHLSAGLFDLTIGALDQVWHFNADLEARVPTAQCVAQALEHVDFRRVQLDAEAGTARLTDSKVAVNLGGIAKGYAVDAAVAILRAAGLHDVVVQAGGDLFAAGQRQSVPWRIGLRDPRGLLADDVLGYVSACDQAVSTAGDYERGFEIEGQRYHHIIDPRTGYPSHACQSVTVVAPSAWLADAVDDVLFVMGPTAGLAWLAQLDDVEAIIVDGAGKTFISAGLQGRVHLAASRGTRKNPTAWPAALP